MDNSNIKKEEYDPEQQGQEHNDQQDEQQSDSSSTLNPSNSGDYSNGASSSTTNGQAKLFVGQLPKTSNEDELKIIFEPFGRVVEFTLIQDRATGTHRGCGFLTYETRAEAEAAMLALHDQKTFPPAKHPIQIRWAIGEADRQEHKLFVGNLPKEMDDDAVRNMFTPYGELESVNVLRHPTGESRGCAFVKYKTREEALNGMTALNGHAIDERHTLIVKVAENEQQKKQRKAMKQQQHGNPYGYPAQPAYGYSMPMYGGYGYPNPGGYAPTAAYGGNTGYGANTGYAANTGYGASPSYGNTAYPAATTGYGAANTGYGAAAPSPYPAYPSYYPAVGQPPQTQSPGGASDGAFIEGPLNSNLFVYHLPQHIGSTELAALFSSYGKVLSTKVFYDKTNGQSKGYGFIALDNPESASTAIANLNGYSIANKRLKVSLKTKKDRFQPY